MRVRRAATEGRRTSWGWGREQPDGRTGPSVVNGLGWVRPPAGCSDDAKPPTSGIVMIVPSSGRSIGRPSGASLSSER